MVLKISWNDRIVIIIIEAETIYSGLANNLDESQIDIDKKGWLSPSSLIAQKRLSKKVTSSSATSSCW